MIENGLFQLLSNDSQLLALLSGNKNIFPMIIPKDTVFPAVVYQGISSSSINSLDGENPTQSKRFQFDSYAADYFTARKLSNRIHALLVPLSDTAPNYPYTLPDGTLVQSAIQHLDMDAAFEPGDMGNLYRALLDIEIYFVSSS